MSILANFGNLKSVVKQCYQICQFQIEPKLVENVKNEKETFYIKFIKKAKNGQFWWFFENLKLVVK